MSLLMTDYFVRSWGIRYQGYYRISLSPSRRLDFIRLIQFQDFSTHTEAREVQWHPPGTHVTAYLGLWLVNVVVVESSTLQGHVSGIWAPGQSPHMPTLRASSEGRPSELLANKDVFTSLHQLE